MSACRLVELIASISILLNTKGSKALTIHFGHMCPQHRTCPRQAFMGYLVRTDSALSRIWCPRPRRNHATSLALAFPHNIKLRPHAEGIEMLASMSPAWMAKEYSPSLDLLAEALASSPSFSSSRLAGTGKHSHNFPQGPVGGHHAPHLSAILALILESCQRLQIKLSIRAGFLRRFTLSFQTSA